MAARISWPAFSGSGCCLNIYRQGVLEPRNQKRQAAGGADHAEDLIDEWDNRATMNAVIACGGTGGHLFPGIAVAEVLRERGHEVMLFISEKEVDTLALAGHADFRFEKLPTSGCRRFILAGDLRFSPAIQPAVFPLPIDLSQI